MRVCGFVSTCAFRLTDVSYVEFLRNSSMDDLY